MTSINIGTMTVTDEKPSTDQRSSNESIVDFGMATETVSINLAEAMIGVKLLELRRLPGGYRLKEIQITYPTGKMSGNLRNHLADVTQFFDGPDSDSPTFSVHQRRLPTHEDFPTRWVVESAPYELMLRGRQGAGVDHAAITLPNLSHPIPGRTVVHFEDGDLFVMVIGWGSQ